MRREVEQAAEKCFKPFPQGLKSLCGNCKIGTSAAEQFAEKCQKPFPQGLKPNESQALIVGAKAPTP